jgi:hypothetical protein
MKRKYKRLIPFGNRLIRPTSLGDRLIRLAPFGNRLIRPTSLRNRLIRSALFGDRIIRSTPLIYRRSSGQGIGFNRVLPLLGGVGLGSVMMALLDPLARGRRRTRMTPLGYWRRSRQGIGFDRVLPLLGGVGLGGVLMALLEPLAGGKRRARMYDGTGLAARAFSAFKKEDVPDDVLVGRVRSRLSRLVSRPHAIEVYADQGRVTLAGAVLSHELERLLKQVSKMPGVRSVNNRLEFHRRSEDISSPEDGRGRAGTRFDLMQADWSPARRLLSTLGGSALLAYGIRRGDWAGAALGTVGAGLCARGATNRGLKRLVGIGRGLHAVDFHKTINIKAPVNVV